MGPLLYDFLENHLLRLLLLLDAPTTLESIKLNNRIDVMCLTPQADSCEAVVEGTPLVYKTMPNTNCNHPHMLYRYNPEDKSLVHDCTGMSLCANEQGVVVHSHNCKGDEARYEHTQVWLVGTVSVYGCTMY